MADLTLPCWSFPPNWAGGVLEALEWRSSVATSPKGVEQRRMLRLSPRRVVEFQVLGIGAERSTVDLATWAAGGSDFNLPLWWDYARLTAGASASATVLMMDTTYSEFEAGGLAFVQGPDAETFDVVEIVSVAADRLNLVAPGTTRPWVAGTRVFPMRQARFVEQPQATRHSDKVATYQCSFLIAEKNVYQAVAPTETYLGYRVYREAPNETGTLTVQWSRMLEQTDNGTAIPYRVDTARYGIAQQQHEFFINGRAEHRDFRRLLYWLRGRVRPVWVPTFSIDMRLLSAASSGATTLTIEKVGVAAYVNFGVDPDHPEYAYPGRRHIMLQMRDESAVFALLTNAVDNGDGTETITLSAPLGVAVSPAAIKRISFIALMRLNQDRVEINHASDQAGVSQSVVTFVTTPENRQADSWTVEAWEGIMTSETCTLCEAPRYIRPPVDDINLSMDFSILDSSNSQVWTLANLTDDSYGWQNCGYRYWAGSLEFVGPILWTNPQFVFDWVSDVYGYVFDNARNVAWMWGQVRLPTTAQKRAIFKVDLDTGTCISAFMPVGTGVPTVVNLFHLFIHPVTGDLWLLTQSGTNYYAHILDPTTHQPTGSWGTTGGVNFNFNVVMDAAGNFFFIRNAAFNSVEGRQIWKFDTGTKTWSNPYTHPINNPYILTYDSRRNRIYVCNNIVADGMDEFDPVTLTATGHNIPMPAFDGAYNLHYDAVNDVFWGLSWGGEFGSGGGFDGVMPSGEPYGHYYFPGFPGNGSGSLTDCFNVPIAGMPNAFYGQVAQYFDVAETDYGQSLVKIPMCNVVRE